MLETVASGETCPSCPWSGPCRSHHRPGSPKVKTLQHSQICPWTCPWYSVDVAGQDNHVKDADHYKSSSPCPSDCCQTWSVDQSLCPFSRLRWHAVPHSKYAGLNCQAFGHLFCLLSLSDGRIIFRILLWFFRNLLCNISFWPVP